VAAQYPERAIYVAAGQVEVAGQTLNAGQMAVIAPSGPADIRARQASIVMALGGDPVGERFMFWNFVSSSKDRLEQAKEDWRQGRMKLPVGDDEEFIPLPENPSKT
jgi:redox-sensitive bicupin YhaK (pirin superfamily)